MPRRKKRKIHAPLKQDIQLYREMQKEKSPDRAISPIASTSGQEEGSNIISSLPFTTLSEGTLYKKPKDKSKNVEPSAKIIRLDEQEIDLNLTSPEYLNISQKEFCTILNTPEKIFTLLQDTFLGDDDWELDKEFVDMTDEDFDEFIGDIDNLEDIWNSRLDENEKEEQKIKETLFRFLLDTEKELASDFENSTSSSVLQENICLEKYQDKTLYQEEILNNKKKDLKNRRKKQRKEKELLEKLEQDLEILKQKEGTREFDANLYDKIKNEIILKKRRINSMEKSCIRSQRYRESEKGKETIRRYTHSDKSIQYRTDYRSSEKGQEAQKRYLSSEKGKIARKKYVQSEKGKESMKKYQQSDKGKESMKRYKESQKGKESRIRYEQSEKGERARIRSMEKKRQKRLEEKLRAEIDPEFKKILEEKKRIKNEENRIRREKKKLEKLLLNN